MERIKTDKLTKVILFPIDLFFWIIFVLIPCSIIAFGGYFLIKTLSASELILLALFIILFRLW